MENSTAFDNLNTREPESQPGSSASSTNPHLWEISCIGYVTHCEPRRKPQLR
jgi:hypothetical protein